MIVILFHITFSVPIYKKNGNHLDISGDGEITSSDIKTKSQYDKMESCKINCNITVIGKGAFEGCSLLSLITLPSSLLVINSDSFSGTILKEISIPKNVESILIQGTFKISIFSRFIVNSSNEFFSEYDDVLYNKDQTVLLSCPKAKKNIKFAPNVTEIGSYAFWSTSINEIKMPDSIEVLNTQSFVDVQIKNMISFGMKSKLTIVPSNSFWNSFFDEIIIPPGVKELKSRAFCYSKLSRFSFMGESNLTHIQSACFLSCKKLVTIELPKSIEFISTTAFSGCTSLNFISVQGGCKNYRSSDTGYLLKEDLSELIFVPPGATSLIIYNETKLIAASILQLLTNISINAVTVGSGNEYIAYDSGVFYQKGYSQAISALGSVRDVVIHSNTTILSTSLFSGIENLRALSFASGSNCTQICGYCFTGCINLETVELPDTISEIGERAFEGSGIKSFMIPRDLKSIPALRVNCWSTIMAGARTLRRARRGPWSK